VEKTRKKLSNKGSAAKFSMERIQKTKSPEKRRGGVDETSARPAFLLLPSGTHANGPKSSGDRLTCGTGSKEPSGEKI